MPRVLNARVDAIPADAVWIDRTTEFGNPYVVGRDGERGECVRLHAEMVDRMSHRQKELLRGRLRGKDLVCWCAPAPCHGDKLLAVANEEPDPT